jgi:hypothetical protein
MMNGRHQQKTRKGAPRKPVMARVAAALCRKNPGRHVKKGHRHG